MYNICSIFELVSSAEFYNICQVDWQQSCVAPSAHPYLIDPEIDRVDRLSRSFKDGVESSWEKGLKSSRPIESIVWQLSWVEVTEVD